MIILFWIIPTYEEHPTRPIKNCMLSGELLNQYRTLKCYIHYFDYVKKCGLTTNALE